MISAQQMSLKAHRRQKRLGRRRHLEARFSSFTIGINVVRSERSSGFWRTMQQTVCALVPGWEYVGLQRFVR